MPGIRLKTFNTIVGKLAGALKGKTYAMVGCSALAMLEIRNSVTSVDVFVPSGTTSRRIDALCRSTSRFKCNQSASKVWYVKDSGDKEAVRFWEPKDVCQPFPDSKNDIVMVDKIPVLKPTMLLNIYCANFLVTRDAEAAEQSAADIEALLKHIAKQTKKEVSNATPAFLTKLGGFDPQIQVRFSDLGFKLPR
ncbi:uncharacterized protein B0H64DRAFT_440874 [Chaetomium fimeti]|uniref:Uncharacterized protein n=1 Tax=Chaetomium fimeti TaxID=1854472 RepID=A0AAE0LTP9_9PEZI|nr:hypothetical protein B0H64DRAFT_440874 [Chaetomium fimeti]